MTWPFYDGVPEPKSTYEDALNQPRAYFGACSSVRRHRKNIFQARQGAAETVTQFACRLHNSLVCANFPVRDDVLIFASSKSEHDERLMKVLQILNERGVITSRLNRDKCFYGRQQIEFLGQQLTGDGFRPTDDKLNSLRNFPCPSDQKELRSFFGTFELCRSMIHSKFFGKIALQLSKQK